MMLGVIVFNILKNKYIVRPDGGAVGGVPKKTTDGGEEQAKFSNKSVYTWAAAAVALIATFYFVIGENLIYSFIYSSGIALAGLILSDSTLTLIERQRIMVLYIVAFFVIFFWACFEQAGSSLTFIADKQTDLHFFGWEMPPSIVQNANSLFIMIFAPVFSWIWLGLQKRKMEPSSPVKQSYGLALLAIGFLIIALQVKDMGNAKMGVSWLLVLYLLHTLGELCLSPIGLSLVSKLAPLRFSSLLMGVWFLSNASGYALAGKLGALLPPTGTEYEAATAQGINLKSILDGAPATAEQMAKLAEMKITTVYPKFAGFTIHNLYEFFMVFVILPGAAAVILFLISPKLKKMMHGVR
jgi:POT family proton-dependent oligopeptide transporter